MSFAISSLSGAAQYASQDVSDKAKSGILVSALTIVISAITAITFLSMQKEDIDPSNQSKHSSFVTKLLSNLCVVAEWVLICSVTLLAVSFFIALL